MNQIIEKLKEYGADVDGAMGRFLGDVELYQTCFDTLLEEEAFVKLGKAIEASNYEKAFEYAHTLKGIIGNMGLTPLYQIICTMVEELRRNEYFNLQNHVTEMMDQMELLKQLAR